MASWICCGVHCGPHSTGHPFVPNVKRTSAAGWFKAGPVGYMRLFRLCNLPCVSVSESCSAAFAYAFGDLTPVVLLCLGWCGWSFSPVSVVWIMVCGLVWAKFTFWCWFGAVCRHLGEIFVCFV